MALIRINNFITRSGTKNLPYNSKEERKEGVGFHIAFNS